MTNFFDHLKHEFVLPLQNPVLVFSLILFIILLAPILLKRLNIPGIIGLIISGVIIGPHGFNILENNFGVQLFSTIGLLYIMFIAGLELDLNEFKANRNKSLVFGAYTFLIPIAIGFPVMYYVLGYFYDFDFNASFLTASMFATHTLIAYPIVSKMGVSKNQAVAITVGGTILTDTAVLIILAIILGNSKGTLDQAFWVQFGVSLAIFSAIMFILIPRVAKWFFKKLESEKHAHYIFVLAVVFFAAFLAEAAGIEAIIGAFVAGLALNPLIPNSSALMNRIEFMGNSLFIPFFLISVGMLVDVSVLLSGSEAIVVSITLSVVAIVGKWLAAWFTQKTFKYTSAERQVIFGLSSGHAAATLAIIMVGYREGIIDEGILNGTIVLILITCVIASFATEKAAKKIAIAERDITSAVETKGQSKYNERILIPVANLDFLEKLLDFALIIKDKNSDNPVSLLSVVPNNDEAETNILKYRNELEKFIVQGSATETNIDIITTIDHNPASGIARAAKEIMADFVILGWPRKSAFIDRILGEKIDSIVNNIDKNLIIGNFTRPLIENKKLVFICPPFSEKEIGFIAIVQKVIRISQEYTIPITLYSEEKTYKAIQSIMKTNKLSGKINHINFTYWEDFLIITKEFSDNDLIIFNAARRGSISYASYLEKVPEKLERYLNKNNLIVFYPQENTSGVVIDDYGDFSAAPLNKGIEAFDKLGRGIGSIFRKDKDKK